ncbi:hypothetical protein MLD38_003076 [Melastoma candidum]|uniref:Uncharacterized protein n=1 Tax=Melastoma candidum TaxID=119954 RepID=A0ACB9S1M9_9MYRT|nr:hypothetical protein MLD38_003076 [Melastoma candidum]
MPLTVSALRLFHPPPPPPPTAVSLSLLRPPSIPIPAVLKPCLSRWRSGGFLYLGERCGPSGGLGWNFELSAKAENGKGGIDGSGVVEDEAERAARGESTMPERFRYLTKEAPDSPVRWPFFVAMAFLVYAWRVVLLELANWKKAVGAIVGFVGYLLKLGLALIFHFIGDPVTAVIRGIETGFYSVRAFYSSIISALPVSELIVVIILASIVLSIGESVVPDSVSSQPYVLTTAGLAGLLVVRGYITVLFFLMVLVGTYGFSRFIKKRDDVTSALPAAAVVAGVGAPWLRLLAIASYLALAIYYYSKNHSQEDETEEVSEGKEAGEVTTKRQLPLPLLGSALAVGIHAAAKWAGRRHLTWMIV